MYCVSANREFPAVMTINFVADGLQKEVCSGKWESLNASCGIQEVLVMSQASYGLMRVGRCVTGAVETGCGADVLHLADMWCSGRKECSVQVPNKDLVLATAGLCSDMYAQYLEVDYRCVSGRIE